MSADSIQPDLSPVERLEAELRAAIEEGSRHADMSAEHERLMMDYRRAHRECLARVRQLQAERDHAKRIADGYCAKHVSGGDAWHTTYSPCKNKAKPGMQFCGVHSRG